MAIVGPGSVGEAVLRPSLSEAAADGFGSTIDMLSASSRPQYDVFSYCFTARHRSVARRWAPERKGRDLRTDDKGSAGWS
jgi:hypothetical protein